MPAAVDTATENTAQTISEAMGAVGTMAPGGAGRACRVQAADVEGNGRVQLLVSSLLCGLCALRGSFPFLTLRAGYFAPVTETNTGGLA